ncbi:MAG: ELM1/GtrOC1 family putative glycosyltransferase [Candidatus Omnitrophota bacterium]
MNKDSLIDYFGCIVFRSCGPLLRSLPKRVSLALGRLLGTCVFYCDGKHRQRVYANLKSAFGAQRSPGELFRLAHDFYRSFGQNLIEIFFIPQVDRKYINRYIRFEGLGHIQESLQKGKGLIFLGIHEGSWELSNILSANLGVPFHMFVNDQKMPRLNRLLNSYRSQKGCSILQRKNEIRQLIEILKRNQAVGMTLDQGGKAGVEVSFFGKGASMSSGAVRLALKYGVAIVPVFFTRVAGPVITVFIEPAFALKETGDLDADIRDNVQALTHVFEKYITRYPQEYLWIYKIWKYSRERFLLILDDGKTGHLRQSESLAKITCGYLADKGIRVNTGCVRLKYKSVFLRQALTLASCFSAGWVCQGCLSCLKVSLEASCYRQLKSQTPDIIISCGSSGAAVNRVLSRESLAKSLVVMRPSILDLGGFDLVVMPRHDNPPRGKNIAVTAGALNLIDREYIESQAQALKRLMPSSSTPPGPAIGILIGGDTKNFCLEPKAVAEVFAQVKALAAGKGFSILVSTSRRTSKTVEALIKSELRDEPRCLLQVIANERNIPEAVGGILGLSRLVVVSPESISMISEAAGSGKHVIVFQAAGLRRRHGAFLKQMSQDGYIHLCHPVELSGLIERLFQGDPAVLRLENKRVIEEKLRRIM